MKKLTYTLLLLIIILTGCSKDEPAPPVKDTKQMTLVYAVNRNNLSSNLTLNKGQMLEALQTLPENEYVILLFQTFNKNLGNNQYEERAGLYRAVSGKNAEFELIKEYSRSLLSTDPKRISEVINDALGEKCEIRNLFFWGHGSAWVPSHSPHTSRVSVQSKNPVVAAEPIESGMELYSYGGDYNTDWADITEIRDAIPSGVFETIWFDCCYMSNIETVYELKDKCRWMVCYPTEIAARGLPYDVTLPYIFNDSYDLKSAAQSVRDYYVLNKTAVTVSLLDMKKIENVAKACKAIYASGSTLPSYYGLQNYSRMTANPLYDFRQYAKEYAEANDAENLVDALDKALKDFVVYTDASERDFNGRPIVMENYSGISTHYFVDGPGEAATYYKELGWYNAVYK